MHNLSMYGYIGHIWFPLVFICGRFKIKSDISKDVYLKGPIYQYLTLKGGYKTLSGGYVM